MLNKPKSSSHIVNHHNIIRRLVFCKICNGITYQAFLMTHSKPKLECLTCHQITYIIRTNE